MGSHHAHGRACGSNRIQVDNWGGSDKKGDRLEVWVGDRLEVLVVDVDIGGILEVGSGGKRKRDAGQSVGSHYAHIRECGSNRI